MEFSAFAAFFATFFALLVVLFFLEARFRFGATLAMLPSGVMMICESRGREANAGRWKRGEVRTNYFPEQVLQCSFWDETSGN